MSGDLRHSVDVSVVEDAFFDEFADQLSDEQIDVLTTGFRGLGASAIGNPDEIDPLKEPALARQALLDLPGSTLEVAEAPFVLPLLPLLEAAKQDVPPEIRVLGGQKDFFLVKFGINAVVKGKERFRALEIKFDYPNELGLLTYALAPDTEIEKRFSTEASVTIGLDASLGFKVPHTRLPAVSVGGSASGDVKAGFMYQWEYALLRANVVATGVKSSYARWQVERPERLIGSVELVAVLTTPKGCERLEFDVDGRYEVDRGWAWWRRTTPVILKSNERYSVPLHRN